MTKTAMKIDAFLSTRQNLRQKWHHVVVCLQKCFLHIRH